jgi:hypothetical protein
VIKGMTKNLTLQRPTKIKDIFSNISSSFFKPIIPYALYSDSGELKQLVVTTASLFVLDAIFIHIVTICKF